MPANLTDHLSSALEARRALMAQLHAEQTNAYRLFHGSVEGESGLSVDRYGDALLVQTFHRPLPPEALAALEAFYAEDKRYPGWVELGWSQPTGAELEAVVQQLKALKLTIRNTPMQGPAASGTCLFTGKPAVETIYVARSY